MLGFFNTAILPIKFTTAILSAFLFTLCGNADSKNIDTSSNTENSNKPKIASALPVSEFSDRAKASIRYLYNTPKGKTRKYRLSQWTVLVMERDVLTGQSTCGVKIWPSDSFYENFDYELPGINATEQDLWLDTLGSIAQMEILSGIGSGLPGTSSEMYFIRSHSTELIAFASDDGNYRLTIDSTNEIHEFKNSVTHFMNGGIHAIITPSDPVFESLWNPILSASSFTVAHNSTVATTFELDRFPEALSITEVLCGVGSDKRVPDWPMAVSEKASQNQIVLITNPSVAVQDNKPVDLTGTFEWQTYNGLTTPTLVLDTDITVTGSVYGQGQFEDVEYQVNELVLFSDETDLITSISPGARVQIHGEILGYNNKKYAGLMHLEGEVFKVLSVSSR